MVFSLLDDGFLLNKSYLKIYGRSDGVFFYFDHPASLWRYSIQNRKKKISRSVNLKCLVNVRKYKINYVYLNVSQSAMYINS